MNGHCKAAKAGRYVCQACRSSFTKQKLLTEHMSLYSHYSSELSFEQRIDVFRNKNGLTANDQIVPIVPIVPVVPTIDEFPERPNVDAVIEEITPQPFPNLECPATTVDTV
jgi:transposase-like protein